jgi:hypothetical protein
LSIGSILRWWRSRFMLMINSPCTHYFTSHNFDGVKVQATSIEIDFLFKHNSAKTNLLWIDDYDGLLSLRKSTCNWVDLFLFCYKV